MPVAEDWEHLPDKLLIAIFSQLQDVDLVRASCTCKNWRRVYHDPGVWKVKTFDLRHLECSKKQAVEAFVKTFGPNFEHIKIIIPTVGAFDTPPIKALRFIDWLLNSLCRLNKEKTILKTFELPELDFHNKMYNVPQVMCSLTKTLISFLSSQSGLTKLVLKWTVLDKPVDLMLLQSLIKSGSTETLQVLNVMEYSCTSCGTKDIKNHVTSFLSICSNLRVLKLNYSYLRTKNMMGVWDSLKHSLKKLVIMAGSGHDWVYEDSDVLTSKWWMETCFKIPELKVYLDSDEMGPHILEFIVPCMPIVHVTWKEFYSTMLRQNLGYEASKFLDHLVTCCNQTLEVVNLRADLKFESPVNKNAIVNLLRSCQNFKQLKIGEFLMSKEVKEEVMDAVRDKFGDDSNVICVLSHVSFLVRRNLVSLR